VLGVKKETAPRLFQLSQSYPQPFNPSATIKFSVEKMELAQLVVCDILGREVARLFDGTAEPGRYYTCSFNAAKYGSGMYIYRLQTDSRVAVRKSTFIR